MFFIDETNEFVIPAQAGIQYSVDMAGFLLSQK